MKTNLLPYIVLFYLGCAPELKLKGFEPEISKN